MNHKNNIPNIMEGFYDYLQRKNKTNSSDRYIKVVRRFHNYIGKTYYDVQKTDIQNYLDFLVKFENLKYTSLRHHIVGISEFYKYLAANGYLDKNPWEE